MYQSGLFCVLFYEFYLCAEYIALKRFEQIGGKAVKISKALNNSCGVVLDDYEKEMILMGNGIGFGKSPGDSVDKTRIDKVFVLENEGAVSRFEQLLQRVPEAVITISETLIEEAQTMLSSALDESIHISLPDHMDGALTNIKNGICLRNSLLLEIKKFYPKEYALGCMGLELMEKQLSVSMPEDEAGFLAMHFINAQSRQDHVQARAVIGLVDEISQMIESEYKTEFSAIDRESLVYCRYMTHLKFFAQRILTKTCTPENVTKMLERSVRCYTKAYAVSVKVCDYIEKNYHYAVSDDEVTYLTIHLVQLFHGRSNEK